MKRTLLLSFAAMALVVSACSAAASPSAAPASRAPAAAAGDIVETATAAGSFKTLLTAATAAGLVETLKGEGPLTLFAPTDAAFAALPAGKLDSLLKDPAALKKVLLYHVVKGGVPASTVATLNGKSVGTMSGSKVQIKIVGGNVFLNRLAKVTTADVMASNGYIHIINKVLIPKA